MRFGDTYLAVDWGTTNRRVFLMERGKVTRTERDDHGVTAVAPGGFEVEVAAIRARFGDLAVLMAGMVGSNIGWRVAPYVPAPAGLDEVAAGLLWIDDRTAIVPGLSIVENGRGDVMRGEEVQLLGAVAAGLTPADAVLVQPGTHCKWATMRAGRVERFVTAMTGELFSLIRHHGLLAAQLGAGEVRLGEAFLDGVEAGRGADLAASLFGIRGSGILGVRPPEDAVSFASGLLIGNDVAARLPDYGREAYILADPVLGGLYVAAVEALGGRAWLVDSHAAFVAGIVALAGRV